jgi:plastocyanin
MRLRSMLIPTAAAIIVLVVALVVRNQPATTHAAPATTKASTAVRSGHVTVAISNYAFAPKALTVKVGTRVSWTNHDSTAHTATADKSGFDTGTIQPHATRTVDFKHPGTFTYHCAFHAFMTATITVKP